jgi:hypothetical protein
MVLDPQAKALLAKLAEQGLPSTDEMSLPQAREAIFIFKELEGEPQPNSWGCPSSLPQDG